MNVVSAALAVFWADVRSMRRLVRTWVFVVLSLLLGFGLYFQYANLHALLSSSTPSVGYLSPRFLMPLVGGDVITIFLLAIVALGFDIRVRDEREGIVDVLDSRPIANTWLLAARLAALVTVVWAPMVFLFASVFAISHGMSSLDGQVGEPVEAVSLLATLTLQALPAFVLWGSVVMFLAVVVRNRVAVIVMATSVFALHLLGTAQAPIYLGTALAGLTPTTDAVVSDMLPRFATSIEYAQRGTLLLLAGGMLCLTSAIYPRRGSANRVLLAVCGGALLVVGAAATGLLVRSVVSGVDLREKWRAAHRRLDHGERPDVVNVAGRVVIDPGESLLIDLDIALRGVAQQRRDIVFTLNPGMRLESVRIDGRTTEHTHELGVLTVQDPLAGTEEDRVLSVVARGIPDPMFAYLDSAIEVDDFDALGVNLLYLGAEASLFESDYVALMPGVHWMPTPGPAIPSSRPLHRRAYALDLTVEVPPDWLVAGPGLRTGQEGVFQFHPRQPVTNVAILASAFERRSANVAGIEVELLISPKHLQNVRYFADTSTELVARLQGTFAELKRLDLPYPYRGLSAVEVPAYLRLYEGGWRMASAQAYPGVLLLREHGFPTAMFAHGPDSPDDDMAQGAAKLALLETYVESDVSGGNPFHGLARNLWSFQANAVGPDALPVNALTEQLAMQLVSTDSVGAFFSVYEATRVGMAVQTLLQTTDAAGVPSAVQGRRVHGVAETARRLMLDRPSVWEAVLATPLSELVAVTDARTKHEILALRIPPIAEYVFDEIGREGVARLLAQTLQRRRGESYTTEEFEALARRNGANLKGALGDWLNDAKLPGFVASDLDVRRIVTDDATTAPYQLLVHIRNDEPTPGPVVLAFEDADTGGRETQSAPIHLAGNQTLEVGLLAQREPDRIWFAPYLSLNRGRIYLTLPDVEWRTLAADASALPFVGSRGSTWQPTAIHGVLVDDLSPGFRIANSPHEGMRLKGNPTDNVAELDHGVPIWTTLGEGWQRQVIAGAVGKYRHTIVRTGPGDGNAWAIFTANLPVSGRWRAEYHLPVGTLDQLGSYGIEVMTDHPGVRSGAVFEDRIEFDGSAAQVGWNPLGEFEVTEATTIRMSVSDETTGTSVVADAVRWIRVVATER